MKTTNYELFSFFDENRAISHGNVKSKKESILKMGYIESLPIIVTENFQIIDGQHRFIALKELEMPIYYQIEHLNPQEAMIELNKNQQIWRLGEYIHHYAALGLEEFVTLYKAISKHKSLGTTAVITCYGLKSGGSKHYEIKNGGFLNLNKNGEQILEYLLLFSDLNHY